MLIEEFRFVYLLNQRKADLNAALILSKALVLDTARKKNRLKICGQTEEI